MANRSPENGKELDVKLEWVPVRGTGGDTLLVWRRSQGLAQGLVKACDLPMGSVQAEAKSRR